MSEKSDQISEDEASSPQEATAKSGLMKKVLSIGVRVLIAVVGLTYVAYNLSLHDQVRLPIGFLDAQQATEVDVRVIDQDEKGLKVQLKDKSTRELTWEQMGQGKTNAEDQLIKPWLRPGLITTIWNANWLLLGLACVMMGLIFPVQNTRWWLLMRCRGIDAGWFRCFRLLMVGCFYNNFMVGSTGGDVMKAVYVARGQDQKTIAVMSVIVDRVIGLIALLLLGAIAGLFIMNDPEARQVAISVWILVAMMSVGMVVYFSSRIRKVLGVDWVLARIPGKDFFNKVDQAAVAYRGHKPAVLTGLSISLPVHFVISLSTIIILYAVTPETAAIPPFLPLLAIFPVIFLIAAIPISMMGFGVMEPAGIKLLAGLSGPNEVFMTLVLIRFFMLLWSLMGAFFIVSGNLTVQKSETQAEDPSTHVTPDEQVA